MSGECVKEPLSSAALLISLTSLPEIYDYTDTGATEQPGGVPQHTQSQGNGQWPPENEFIRIPVPIPARGVFYSPAHLKLKTKGFGFVLSIGTNERWKGSYKKKK